MATMIRKKSLFECDLSRIALTAQFIIPFYLETYQCLLVINVAVQVHRSLAHSLPTPTAMATISQLYPLQEFIF